MADTSNVFPYDINKDCFWGQQTFNGYYFNQVCHRSDSGFLLSLRPQEGETHFFYQSSPTSDLIMWCARPNQSSQEIA